MFYVWRTPCRLFLIAGVHLGLGTIHSVPQLFCCEYSLGALNSLSKVVFVQSFKVFIDENLIILNFSCIIQSIRNRLTIEIASNASTFMNPPMHAQTAS